ncbi:hypothetical protein BH09MYX1_BH09MYX1_16120 [soil metagenome]
METNANKRVIERFFADALRLATADATLDEIVDIDVENHSAGKRGIALFKRLIHALIEEAPDQVYTVEMMIAEGDLVVARAVRSGTAQKDRFRGYPVAPGKSFRSTHAHFFRLAHGKITEHWGVRDDLGMAQQLGAITIPAIG